MQAMPPDANQHAVIMALGRTLHELERHDFKLRVAQQHVNIAATQCISWLFRTWLNVHGVSAPMVPSTPGQHQQLPGALATATSAMQQQHVPYTSISDTQPVYQPSFPVPRWAAGAAPLPQLDCWQQQPQPLRIGTGTAHPLQQLQQQQQHVPQPDMGAAAAGQLHQQERRLLPTGPATGPWTEQQQQESQDLLRDLDDLLEGEGFSGIWDDGDADVGMELLLQGPPLVDDGDFWLAD